MILRTTRNKHLRHKLRTAALILSAFSLGTTGCGPSAPTEQVDQKVSASFSIKSADFYEVSEDTYGQGRLSSFSFDRSSLAFSFSDVSSIRIDVKDKDSGEVLYVNFDLYQSAGEWTGTVPFLPKGKALVFTAKASKSDGSLLFIGTAEQTLSANNEKVIITLAASNDGQTITLPRLKRISVPTAFGSDQSGNVSFSVEANTGEQLTYSITPATGGGTFYPLNGSITLAAQAGTFVSQYAPPTVSVDSEFEHVVKVTNEAGHSITTTFKTKVKKPGTTDGVRDNVIQVLFNPVINAVTASRVFGTGNVIWKADVADDGAAETLSYAWSFTPDGTFDPAPAFTEQANPTTLQNYTTSLQGELKLAVTDANGGITTLYYQLKPDQFPDNPTVEGGLTGINAIRAGESHTCALFNDGTLRCWGRNDSGQLGYANTFDIGDDELPYTAGDVALVGKGAKLAVGGNHTCALLNTGFVRCWGLNNYGQLGYNTTENVGDGEAIASYGYVNLGGVAIKIAAGLEHTCALMDTGKVRCWGRNLYGQLGYGNTNNVGDDEQPWKVGDVSVGGTVKDIVAGGYHTCALLDTGKVRCWGYNGNGELGQGNTTTIGDNELPSTIGEVNMGGTVLQLSAGLHHTCALLDTGYMRCWGNNHNGQLGTGYSNYNSVRSYYYGNYNVGDNEVPSAVGDVNTGSKVLQVASGEFHTCALLSTGSIKCWGWGNNGQLGYGNTTQHNVPPSATVDLDGATAYQVTTGAYHTCALLSTGAARCWGYNGYGQLGYGHKGTIGDNELPSTAGDIPLLTPQGK
ncbi:MAG TPA: RTX toxin [Myxococcaceae bacterium]|nr:RTX toxin [Myxococcaceae bacterium]